MKILTAIGAVTITFGMVLAMPVAAKDRPATVRKTVVAPRLSDTDQLQYNYTFLEAVRQQNAGHYAAAFDLVRRCLMMDPQAAEAHFMLSAYWAQMDKDSLALKSLERAAMLRPDNDTYQERLAMTYIGMGNYAKATEVYERLAEVNQGRSDVLGILVQLYKQQKDYNRMLAAINRLASVEGDDDQFVLARMSVYELMGDTKNAYRTLKELAESRPNDYNYTIMLGNWLMQNKRQDEARKLFEQVLKAEPDNAYAQSSMYDYYRAAGQDSLARQMMERILLAKNTPSDNRIQFLRQAIQENESKDGDSTQIIRLLDRMQQALPKDAAVVEMKAAYYSLKKMPEAETNRVLRQLLELAPDNGNARFQLIQSQWAKEDWKAVAELSEPGMLYNPDEMAFYYFTGLARYYQKDDRGALDALQRGTKEINDKSDPKLVSDFYAIMGEIYHNQGNKVRAYAAFDSCLQWKPDHYMTLNNYAYFLSIEGGDLKKAEQMSAKTVVAEPKNSIYLDTYAWILFKLERYAEAKIYIDRALQNDSDSTLSADVLEHAGDIYLKAGDKVGAVVYWQKALDAGGDAAALNKKIRIYRKRK
jgi:tetratricopeptide (TPR) repeat protein